MTFRLAFVSLFISCLAATAENASAASTDPVLEPPTLHSLGVYWVVKGDQNKNAVVALDYRKSGEQTWHKAHPLLRVETGAHRPNKHQSMPSKFPSKIDVPDGAWLFAGSVLFLTPDTQYDLRLTLTDPDGGGTERLLKSHTIAEPVAPANAPAFHVVPGNGKNGGAGTQADPFKGIRAAQQNAKPGDVFLLHAGTYEGEYEFVKSGEPGKPIIWRGAGDGETVFDGKGKDGHLANRIINAPNLHDVWFENFTVRNGKWGFTLNESARIVVRRCKIINFTYGIAAVSNPKDTVSGLFISDNTIEGPCVWPRTEEKGIEAARGIQVCGTGHVICYNRISGFADAIDTFQDSPRCAAIDIHNNEISECTDDGIELDYSERNVRCFNNRLTNVFQGISTQPVYGGPAYIVRNALYNVDWAPFKLNQSPSGVLLIHNSVVKHGMPMAMQSEKSKVRNCYSRNNLYVGTAAGYAAEISSPLVDCDFDYDGFAGGPFNLFIKVAGVRYPTFDAMKQKAPIYRHAIWVESAEFANGVKPPEDVKKPSPLSANDLRLKAGNAAIDAGEKLPGFNDGFSGAGPDLGAYEAGAELPHYGPRPAK